MIPKQSCGNEGELVGIVGPNGSGKTTILQIISGVLKPAHGRVVISDSDVAHLSTKEKAKLVSVVPQSPTLPPTFTVRELVLMGRNPHLRLLEWEGQTDLKIAKYWMELTGTKHLADRSIYTLSGGERQRAILAMALTQETPILLMDEPTSNLDLVHQTSVMDLIQDIQRVRRGTVLIAMHDLTLASQYCNRLIMLANGKVFAEGEPTDVLTKENICAVYDTKVVVVPHPENRGTIIVPASNR